MSLKARLYLASIILLGSLALLTELPHFHTASPLAYWCYFAISLGVSNLKVKLPTVNGSMSPLFFFILFGVVQFTLPETLLMAVVATVVQCVWTSRNRPVPLQIAFNATCTAVAVAVTYQACHAGPLSSARIDNVMMLVVAAVVLFSMNTLPVAAAIAMTEEKPLWRVWRECYLWSFPYYLFGRRRGRHGQRGEPRLRMADVADSGPRRLPDLSLLESLSRPDGRREEARRRDGVAAPANHRSAGAGHRGQGSHHARSSAARAGVRDRGGQGTGPETTPNWRRCAPPLCCTTSASWRCRSTSSRNPAS